jgi:hypothetical protein
MIAFFCSIVMPLLFLMGLRVGVVLDLVGTNCAAGFARGDSGAGDAFDVLFFVRIGAILYVAARAMFLRFGRRRRARCW